MNNFRNISIPFFTAFFLLSSCGNNVSIVSSEQPVAHTFPDGSIAIVNQDSKISYDRRFSNRIVEQTGEVFYVVSENGDSFTVKTKNGKVDVLGTKFNVNETFEELQVEVYEGKVALLVDKTVKEIEKGEKIVYNSLEKDFKKSRLRFENREWLDNVNKDLDQFGEELETELRRAGEEIETEVKKLGKKLKEALDN